MEYLCPKFVSAVNEWLLQLLTAPTDVAPPTRDAGSEAPCDWWRPPGALVGAVTFLQRAPRPRNRQINTWAPFNGFLSTLRSCGVFPADATVT